jgi:hypothetical protein
MYRKHVVVSMIVLVIVVAILVDDVEEDGGGDSIAQFPVETKSSKIYLVNFVH